MMLAALGEEQEAAITQPRRRGKNGRWMKQPVTKAKIQAAMVRHLIVRVQRIVREGTDAEVLRLVSDIHKIMQPARGETDADGQEYLPVE
jgi:hypothetical protein